MEGLEMMKEEGMIDEYFLYKTKGMEIHKAETSGDRPSGYLCSASTSDELSKKIKYVDSHIKAISNMGVDMMMHGLLE